MSKQWPPFSNSSSPRRLAELSHPSERRCRQVAYRKRGRRTRLFGVTALRDTDLEPGSECPRAEGRPPHRRPLLNSARCPLQLTYFRQRVPARCLHRNVDNESSISVRSPTPRRREPHVGAFCPARVGFGGVPCTAYDSAFECCHVGSFHSFYLPSPTSACCCNGSGSGHPARRL